MELSKLVEEILKITNESPYGWLDMDSVEAGEIWKLLNKEKQAEQLTLTDVGKGTELLPDFLYKDTYGTKIGFHGDTEVSEEWNNYLKKLGNCG